MRRTGFPLLTLGVLFLFQPFGMMLRAEPPRPDSGDPSPDGILAAAAGRIRQASQGRPSGQSLPVAQQRKFQYFFHEATRLRIRGDYAASFDMLEHCLTLKPADASVLYELAQYHLVLKNEQKGMDYLKGAVLSDPENYWYASGLVNMLLQKGQIQESALQLEDMVSRFPLKVDSYYLLMQVYEKLGRLDDEIRMLEKLEEMTGMGEQFTLRKVSVLEQAGRPQEAIRQLLKLIDKNPGELDYRVRLGDEYAALDSLDKAFQLYEQVLQRDPSNAMAMYSMASYYQKTGKKDLYDRQIDALMLNPSAQTETRLEVMSRFIGENSETPEGLERIRSLFARVLEAETEEAQIPLLYAQFLYSKGLETEALPVLEKTLEIDPTNTAARMTLLGDAVRKEDYEKVISLSFSGTEANPGQLEFYYYLAVAYTQKGLMDQVVTTCRAALDQAIGSDQQDASMISDFYAILGDTYHQKGQSAEAFAAYDSCLVYNEGNIGALNNYAYYLSLENRDLDRAEEMSYRTIRKEPKNTTYLDTYAWILFKKENYVQARLYIDMAVKNDSIGNADVLEHCGDIYYMNHETDRAVEFWQMARKAGSQSAILEDKIKQRRMVKDDEK